MDPVSGMLFRDLAFILNRFLPTVLFHLGPVTEYGNSGNVESISCGSIPEGFVVPNYVQARTGESRSIMADADVLFVDRQYKVIRDIGTRSRKNANKPALVLSTNGCKVGFVRLRRETGDYFLLPELFVNNLHAYPFVSGKERQGPAIKIYLEEITEGKISKSSIYPQKIKKSVDYVYALKYDHWPEEAAEWRIRKRLSGWPSLDLIAELEAEGCHLVQKAHPQSSQPEVEWRLSFSKIELVLARSLSNVQRQCFVLFKLAVSLILEIDKSSINQQALSTYHLKTVMFWICERIPASEFTKITIGERYLDLLDRLIDFLDEGFLPNYFVRHNNMISHIRLKERKAILKKLSLLRKYPTRAFIQFEKEYFFFFAFKHYKENIIHDIQELFYPVSYDELLELYMEQGCILEDFRGAFQLLVRHRHANVQNIDVTNPLERVYSDPIMRLLWVVDPSVVEPIKFCTPISENIIFPSRFRSGLARHFLQKRSDVERDLTKLQNEIWTKRIHQTFYQAMNKNVGTSVKDVLDYYSWLIFDQRMSMFEHDFDFLQELQTHLGGVISFPKLVQFDDVDFVTYTTADKYMIHDPLLRKELDDVGQITVPTKIYLYYLLVARKVMSLGRNSPRTKRYVAEMKQVCGEYGYLNETYVRYSALGYGCTYTDSGKLFDITVAKLCYTFDHVLSDQT